MFTIVIKVSILFDFSCKFVSWCEQRCVVASYQRLVKQPLPYQALGFASAIEFVLQMPDVARVET